MLTDIEVGYYTDKGNVKEKNQDAVCIEIADTQYGQVCMAILCDGMGGEMMGEYASRKVIETFENWFETIFPLHIKYDMKLSKIGDMWAKMLVDLDEELRVFGNSKSIKLGTTATCMLFWNREYILVQLGDSRAYEIKRNLRQLSKDQSYVQQLVDMKKISKEEAKMHPKRHVLLDCVGGSRPSTPVCTYGKISKKTRYLLCSDGFIHMTHDKELRNSLAWYKVRDIATVQDNLKNTIELLKDRGENDNITAVIIHVESLERKFAFKRKTTSHKGEFHVKRKVVLTEEIQDCEEMQMTTDGEE
ncbi:serine/threonine-protein phosphatase [Lachnospiraceae bacterium OttesenSCG-928-D06]|nr:serine/threonine-protein phosphatase [Lachnospiraceae bacterium OttesenSCG-928-D06]